MEQQLLGYVKFYRQYLVSDIHKASFAARACFIDILLLLDRKTGVLCSTVTDLTRLLCAKDRKTIRKVLRELEECGVIKVTWTTPLEIMVPNWAFFQRIKRVEKQEKATKKDLESEENFPTEQGPKVGKKSPPTGEKIPTAGEKIPTNWGKNPHCWGKNPQPPYACKQEYITRSKQELLKEAANQKKEIPQNGKSLDFLNPQTDLEKFINFYLKGTESPLLNKNNLAIAKALKFEIQHFQSILDRTKDLKQAKEILKEYILQAKGTYSIFYLAQQIDYRRSDYEEKHPTK